MLRPAALNKRHARTLAASGASFKKRNAVVRNENTARRAKYNAEYIETRGIRANTTMRYNGQDVHVVAVDKDAGKVTIVNPKHALVSMLRLLGEHEVPARLLKLRSTITVWANRLRPTL